MGRDKALLPWPPAAPGSSTTIDQTFLGGHIAALQPHSDMVIVVAGANAESIAPVVYMQGAFLVQNRAPELGQFSSLRLGLQEVLNRGRDSAIVALVDRPPVRESTLRTLHDSFLEALEAELWGVVPEYDGKHGHPYFAGRDLLEAFLRAPLTATARDVMHAARQYLQYVPIDDPFITLNVDTPEDYATLVKASNRVTTG